MEGNLTLNEVQDWLPEIQKVSRKAAFDWPGVIEEDDLTQEVCLHILESPGTQQDLEEMDDTARYQTLHKIAQRIASKERVDYERFSGNFRYSVDEVRALMESASDPESSSFGSSWSTGDYTKSGGGHSDQTASAAIENLQVSDAQKQLSQALASLSTSNPRQYDALIGRFVYGQVPPSADKAALMVITRALVSLTTKMNHGHKREHVERPTGPGTRNAFSNSTARYLSKQGWDADYMPAPAHLRDNYIEPEVWDE